MLQEGARRRRRGGARPDHLRGRGVGGWGGEEEEGAGVPHGGELRDRVVRRQVQGVGLHRPRRRLLHLRRHAHPLLLRLRRRRRQRLARRPPPVISTSITTSSSFFSDPSTHRRLLLVQLNCYKN